MGRYVPFSDEEIRNAQLKRESGYAPYSSEEIALSKEEDTKTKENNSWLLSFFQDYKSPELYRKKNQNEYKVAKNGRTYNASIDWDRFYKSAEDDMVDALKDPAKRAFIRFGENFSSLPNLPSNIAQAISGQEVPKPIGEIYIPPSENKQQFIADLVGTGAGELTKGAIASMALAPLNIGGKVSTKIGNLGKGGKLSKFAGGVAGSFAENALEDVVLDISRGMAEGKGAGEIAKDYGESLLWDAGVGLVLGGIPALYKASKAKKAAKNAMGEINSVAQKTIDEIDNAVDNAIQKSDTFQTDSFANVADDVPKSQNVALAARDSESISVPPSITSDVMNASNNAVTSTDAETTFKNAFKTVDRDDAVRATYEIGGKTITGDELIDAIDASLPNDINELEEVVSEISEQQSKINQIKTRLDEQLASKTLKSFEPNPFARFHELDDATKMSLKGYAARRKLEWLKLAQGEVDGTKIRQYFANRMKGIDLTSNPELTKALSKNIEKYVPKSDKTLLTNANKLIETAESKNALYNRIVKSDPKELLLDDEVMAAELMIKDFAQSGDIEKAVDLTAGLSRKGTGTGRSLRVYGLIDSLTPEGSLIYAHRMLNEAAIESVGKAAVDDIDGFVSSAKKYLDSLKELSPERRQKEIMYWLQGIIDGQDKSVPTSLKRLFNQNRGSSQSMAEKIIEAVNMGATETQYRELFSELLNIPHLDANTAESLIELVNKAKGLTDGSLEQAEAFEEIYTLLASKLPSSRWDKIRTWRMMSMLSNPKTHVRNVLSNVANMPQRKLTDAVAQILEKSQDTATRTRLLGWRNTEFGKSIADTVTAETNKAVLEMNQIGKYDISNNVINKHKKIFKHNAIEKPSKFISWALEKGDEPFLRSAFSDSLGQIMTARQVIKPTDDMIKMAKIRALEATFKAENTINDVIVSLKRKKGIGKAVDIVIPFTKTPSNLMVQAFEYSPFGLGKALVDYCMRAKTGKEMAEIINEAAKGIVGTSEMIGIGIYLGASGILNTTHSTKEKDRAVDELKGEQQYGLNILGNSISIDWLQPVAFPIIAGAAIGEAAAGDDVDWLSVLTSGTDSIFDMSMLSGIKDFLGNSYDSTSQQFLGIIPDALDQVIPSAVGAIGRTIDPIQRKTNSDNPIQSFLYDVQNKLGAGGGIEAIGLKPLEPELDIWGNEVYRTGGDLGLIGNAAQQLLNPSNVKTPLHMDDPITQAILQLQDNAGNNDMIPGTVTDDWNLPNTETKVQAMKQLGDAQYKAAAEFINGKSVVIREKIGTLPNGKKQYRNKRITWNTATDEERTKALKNIFNSTRDDIKKLYD